jgi:hypothetical protein
MNSEIDDTLSEALGSLKIINTQENETTTPL